MNASDIDRHIPPGVRLWLPTLQLTCHKLKNLTNTVPPTVLGDEWRSIAYLGSLSDHTYCKGSLSDYIYCKGALSDLHASLSSSQGHFKSSFEVQLSVMIIFTFHTMKLELCLVWRVSNQEWRNKCERAVWLKFWKLEQFKRKEG